MPLRTNWYLTVISAERPIGSTLAVQFGPANGGYRRYLVIGGRSVEGRWNTGRHQPILSASRVRGRHHPGWRVAPAIGSIGAVWAMAGSGGRSKGRFFVQLAQAQLELLLVRQTLGWLPSRMKPAQQVMRKGYPTLLFLFCPVKPATVDPPVHPWRLAREGVDDARPGTQPHADLPDPPNTSIARVLTLRCIGQATALAAGEEMTVAGVQLCNAAAAAPPISGILRT